MRLQSELNLENSESTTTKSYNRATFVKHAKSIPKVASSDNEFQRKKFRTKRVQINTRKKAKAPVDETLSTIKVPKYNYNPLSIAVVKKAIQTAIDTLPKNTDTPKENSEDSPIIESEDSQPSQRTNPREFLIEEDITMDENVESQPTRSQNSQLSAYKLLNTQNSLFLHSQLMKDCNRLAKPAMPIDISSASSISITPNTDNDTETGKNLNLNKEEINPPGSATTRLLPTCEVSLVRLSSTEQSPYHFVFNDQSYRLRESAPPQKKRKVNKPIEDSVASDGTASAQPTTYATLMTNLHKPPQKVVQCAAALLQTTIHQANTIESDLNLRMEQLLSNPCTISSNLSYRFLSHINIVEASNTLITNSAMERTYNTCKEFDIIKTLLKLQFNGNHHVTLTGESMQRKIELTISVKEWSAIQEILQIIHEFTHNAHSYNLQSSNNNQTTLHRALLYLFKTSSKFSNVDIEYRETNSDVVNILNSSFRYSNSRADLASGIDPFIIEGLKFFKHT